MTKVLVLYYSSYGHIETMAYAVAEGAKSAGADIVVKRVPELVPEAVDLEGVEFQGERVASVKLDQLLPVMAKAIQELAAEVRALKAER